MNAKKAKKLFKKYVNNECSSEELELLEGFLESFQNDGTSWSELSFDKELKEEVWSKINMRTNQRRPKKKYDKRFFFKYAAVIICIVGTVIIWETISKTEPALIIEDNPIVLKTGNNELKNIVLGGGETLRDSKGNIIASQHKNQMVYSGEPTSGKIVYNEILVPKGKTFQLILSDGSLVHLNSDSSLKYPVSFVQGEKRKVFLNGEAYFEVAKDAVHPFSVVSQGMDIEVLGTRFNVSCYSNTEAHTVLLEGSVAVSKQTSLGEVPDAHVIKPGQKATLDDDDAMIISEVNVDDYLGWRNGFLVFNNEAFENIVEKIERRYNVVVENDYKDLDSIEFRGTFENETIEDLLNTFKESAGFDYDIINNRIVIKKPE
ncbi:FecR domain-containing protein [uncultured Kriegella sp.]|uniref:FecR family protein n=1 Tax=uncultured Kriegella sp. TaxID=1798910 RepID=UPI0030D8E08A|tara:strand:+ start:90868 stop:91992 length:1125 start_codon:yes stop_codon:yes gene_type:complete